MIKKQTKKSYDGLFDLENSTSATEFTGLIPFAPYDDYARASYNSILDYLPEEIPVAEEKITK